MTWCSASTRIYRALYDQAVADLANRKALANKMELPVPPLH